MKIHFDIIHMCHLNFFKNAIYKFKEDGHEINITYLNRGEIKKVLEKEFPDFELTEIGNKYSPTTLGKIPMILDRAKLLYEYLKKEKPDITAGVGDFILAFCSKLRGIPCVLFYDDYEFKINYKLSKLFASKLVIPDAIKDEGSNIIKYHSFKELAYLHPDIYKPDIKVIKKLGLKKGKYVFIREASDISMNYAGKDVGLLKEIKKLYEQGKTVVVSLEDKSKELLYSVYAIILQEPLDDIYSIMAFAKYGISSGDSMAREMALLGIKCKYTGGRDMMINRPFTRGNTRRTFEPIDVKKYENTTEVIMNTLVNVYNAKNEYFNRYVNSVGRR